MRTIMRLCGALALLFPETASADEPVPTSGSAAGGRAWYERVSIHGSADVYYGYNVNRPADGANFFPGVGTTGKRANNLALNLAALEVLADLDPVTARITLNYGTGIEVLYSGEPKGVAIGAEVFKYVQVATIAYKAPLGKGLLIEAGIMPSHVGFEVFPSKDNFNYTRGYSGEFSPYYQAGLRLGYSFTAELSAALYVLNGWQIIGENNEAKTIGSQISFNSAKWTASLNGLFGPELPGDNTHWRVFWDLILGVRPTEWLSIYASADFGYQALPAPAASPAGAADSSALWWTAYAWARAQVRPFLAFAVRGGYYHDRDGLLSGTPQILGETTCTVEIRPTQNYILKLEGRYDRS